MLEKNPEIRRNCVLVADAANGGVVDVVSPDGEIVHRFHVPQGRHRASQWLDLLEPGYQLQVSEGVVCFQPRMGAVVSTHPLLMASDANPDFQPSAEYRRDLEMRAMLGELREMKLALTKEKRMAEAAKVEVIEPIPDNPAKAGDDKKEAEKA